MDIYISVPNQTPHPVFNPMKECISTISFYTSMYRQIPKFLRFNKSAPTISIKCFQYVVKAAWRGMFCSCPKKFQDINYGET